VAALAYAQTNPNQQTGKDDKIAHDQHAHEKAEVDRNRADYAVLVLIHDSNSPADNVVSRIWLALKPGSRFSAPFRPPHANCFTHHLTS
jgi:hypothetical protein